MLYREIIAKINIKEVIPVCLTITPTTLDSSGSKVISIRDISKELKEEQARSEFISTASHEMRTPVASIEGYLGLALNPQTATIDDRAKSYLDKAHEASQHLGQLFRDLLDTSKLEDEMYPVPVEMITQVKSIAEGMAPAIAAKNLTYTFGATERAAANRIEQLIYCSLDVDFLREIIDNLIQNAIKYTQEGSITVSVEGDHDHAIVKVTDTGIGISREHQSHVFQKFYRVDNSETRSTEGTGLGLYIATQRAKAMGGRIILESTEGKGSTFSLILPRISAESYERQKMAMESTMRPQPTAQNV